MGGLQHCLARYFTSFWRILFLAEPLAVSLPHFSGFENRLGKKSKFTTKMAKWKKEFRRQNSEVRMDLAGFYTVSCLLTSEFLF
jgi:hypothetical protein